MDIIEDVYDSDDFVCEIVFPNRFSVSQYISVKRLRHKAFDAGLRKVKWKVVSGRTFDFG